MKGEVKISSLIHNCKKNYFKKLTVPALKIIVLLMPVVAVFGERDPYSIWR